MSKVPQVFFSNSSDVLCHVLRSQIDQSRTQGDMRRQVVVTPNQFIKKTIQKQLLNMSDTGVTTGILFLEFAPCIIKLFRQVLGRDPHLPSKNSMALFLESMFFKGKCDESVASYIGKNPARRIPPLAEELSSIFLEYGLVESLHPSFFHTWQGALFSEVFSFFENPRLLMKHSFSPPKIQHEFHFFGFQHIPTAYLHFFKKIAEFFPISLYQESPTPEYFGDQVKKGDTLHPMLSSLGTLHRMTLNAVTDMGYDVEHVFLEEKGTNALSVLKQGLQSVSFTPLPSDDSVQLHGTPTLSRALEIAHESIVLKVQESGVSPDECILLFNDLPSAIPYIHKTFGSVEAPIPYQIFDVPIETSGGLFSSLLSFITLVKSRITFDELTLFLEHKSVLEHFGLRLKDAQTLSRWLEETHFRWGLCTKHRHCFIRTEEERGTLEHSMHTLAYGFMVMQNPENVSPHRSSPLSLETMDLKLLDVLYSVSVLLNRFSMMFHENREYAVERWKKEWVELISDLFKNAEGSEVLVSLCESLFEHLPQKEAYTAQSMFRYIERALKGKKGIHGLSLLNGVVCAPLSSEYVVSKPYVYIFGLEEGSFPKEEHVRRFSTEGISKEYIPSRGDIGTSALLSACIHAQKELWLQYTTMHPEDGSQNDPSFLLEPFQLKERTHSVASFLTPKVPFLQSTYQMAVTEREENTPWVFSPDFYTPRLRPKVEQDTWDVRTLRRLFHHPLRAYTQLTLGMYLERSKGVAEEKEFTLSPLDAYSLRQTKHVTHATAHGVLPVGPMHTIYHKKLIDEQKQVEEKLKKRGYNAFSSLSFIRGCQQKEVRETGHIVNPALHFEGRLIYGTLPSVFEDTLLIFDSSSNAIKHWSDILLFSLWNESGSVFFVENEVEFSTADQGVTALLEYAEYAVANPSPLLPDLIEAIGQNESDVVSKKIQQHRSGFLFEDPYISLYMTKNESVSLCEKWGEIAKRLMDPYVEWKRHGRV